MEGPHAAHRLSRRAAEFHNSAWRQTAWLLPPSLLSRPECILAGTSPRGRLARPMQNDASYEHDFPGNSRTSPRPGNTPSEPGRRYHVAMADCDSGGPCAHCPDHFLLRFQTTQSQAVAAGRLMARQEPQTVSPMKKNKPQDRDQNRGDTSAGDHRGEQRNLETPDFPKPVGDKDIGNDQPRQRVKEQNQNPRGTQGRQSRESSGKR